ncbi:MAG: hypothetical protein IJ157_13240 [Clostridia bacterium]|nr:hypothetical protein [Clostridia bacterium]
MKKRVFCLLLSLALMVCFTAQADGIGSFYRHMQYGTLTPYENFVYHYALKVFSRFEMLSDDYLELLMQHIDETRDEDSEETYDIRIWLSQDGRYQFDVQVKQPTYATFAEEIEKAPQYLELTRDNYAEDSNVRMLHEGILRSTPAGDMLETAIAYEETDEYGRASTVVFLYYDIYQDGVEYCFSMYAYDGDYSSAQAMLNEICQTVQLYPVSIQA